MRLSENMSSERTPRSPTIDDLDVRCRPSRPGAPDTPPSVGFDPITTRIVSGKPVTLKGWADRGETWFWNMADCAYDSRPLVDFKSVLVTLNTGQQYQAVKEDPDWARWSVTVTFPQSGTHSLKAEGAGASSAPVSVLVAPAGPPTFTLLKPTANQRVDLQEAGGSVVVEATTSDEFGPRTFTASCGSPAINLTARSSTTFDGTLPIDSMPLGAREVRVTCTDVIGEQSTQTVIVNGVDVGPPRLSVTSPKPSANQKADASGTVTVPFVGKAEDSQSGMVGGSATVEWALSPSGAPTRAKPRNPQDPSDRWDFMEWTTDVPLSGFGAHTVYVWAKDAAGNQIGAPVAHPVTLVSSVVPASLGERLNERQYLVALLNFARDQVTVNADGTVRALTTSDVEGVLGQPLAPISQPVADEAEAANREINQLRIPVELLRKHILTIQASTAPGTAGEAAYRLAAYTSLLAGAGTSYAELRLARAASPRVRADLATRLGIRLSPTRPDELDQLTLDGPELSEDSLEATFGLANTAATLNPLRRLPTPRLLTWQRAALARSWAEQDRAPVASRVFPVIADPDVIGPEDVVAGPVGDPIRQLVTARSTQLSTYRKGLEDARKGASNPSAGLAAVLNVAMPGVDFAKLESDEQAGVDISATLTAAGLERPGLVLLRGLTRLATPVADSVTDAEWSDAFDVLVGAHKRKTLYAAWRPLETGFVLSPDFFVLSTRDVAVNPYRANPQARIEWQALLRVRAAQAQNVSEAIAQNVAVVEEATLPRLRDALLAHIPPPSGGDAGELMSSRFFVDVKAGGTLRTTRMSQALESVQSVLSVLRSGAAPPPAGWALRAVDGFDASWAWMGDLSTWRAATTAFLFPEARLDPTLLIAPDSEFEKLWGRVRGSGSFSAADARKEAKTYLDGLIAGKELPQFTYLLPDRLRDREHQDKLVEACDAYGMLGREVFWAVPMLLANRLQQSGDHQAALDWYWLLFPYDDSQAGSIYRPIRSEVTPRTPDLTFPPDWTSRLNPFTLVTDRPAPFTRATLLAIIRCHLDYADAEFTRETGESVAHARSLYLTAQRLLAAPQLRPVPPTNAGEATLAIPELEALRARVSAQLAKLRQGRNIAGVPRSRPVKGGAVVTQPTPYRFKTLLERAKQLTDQAAQMEAGYLAALEKYDAKSLQLHDAMKVLDMSGAQVTLAEERATQANSAVTAAEAQQNKALQMESEYKEAVAAPPNGYETALLRQYGEIRNIRNIIATADTTIGIAQAANESFGILKTFDSLGGSIGYGSAVIAGQLVRGGATMWLNNVEAQMQANQFQAGLEQRRDEWRRQQSGAHQEALVAAAQVKVANDGVDIAKQEEAIATLQKTQAEATLRFLAGQFTNADLYQWMSGVLGGVYRYFLQQATATARLAQDQLAFERGESAQTLVRNDYWSSSAQTTSGSAKPDRRGLTGAEQLSEDLTELDQYAFRSDRRRLNLAQSFSLAQLMPVEFLAFRDTGTMAFATPTSLFDADFPGHYLRLIRNVRASLVALVPPGRGIRATLRSNGISRVTTSRNGAFEEVMVRHEPATVALTSPVNASGVFDLDSQSEMLLPFEGNGVDTTWEFQLPPAANPFDYSTIVDLIVTIEYTALADEGYRSQVINRLNAHLDRSGDRVLSLRDDFPDEWYKLSNPEPPGGARAAVLNLRQVDFPLQLANVVTSAVGVRLVSRSDVPASVVSLQRGAAGGPARTSDGLASTRRGARTWDALCGTDPVGSWELSFGSDASSLFENGRVEDVLVVLSWTGQAPAWPGVPSRVA